MMGPGGEEREVGDTEQGKQWEGRGATAKKHLSGTLYTATADSTVPAKEGLTDCFYIGSGASDLLR